MGRQQRPNPSSPVKTLMTAVPPNILILLVNAFTFVVSLHPAPPSRDPPPTGVLALLPLNDTQNYSTLNLTNNFAILNQHSQHSSRQKTETVLTIKKSHYSTRGRDVDYESRPEMSQTNGHDLFRREARKKPASKKRKPPPRNKKRPNIPQQDCSKLSGQSARVQNVSDAEGGVILWTGPRSSCFDSHGWLITVPTEHGIVFTFDTVRMFGGFVLMVQEVNRETQVPQKTPPLWKFPDNNFMAPLLVRKNQVLLEVKNVSQNQPANKQNTLPPRSHFNLTYTAHSMAFLPQEMHQYEQGDGFNSSSVMYNCSAYPQKIPKALQCDMTQQCIGGEDEEDCSYKAAGCGDWVSYRHQCLKAFFKPVVDLSESRSPITMPDPAEKICRRDFQGTLAQLPDVNGLELAGKILRQSGYQSMAVGLRKVNPRSPKIKQLYKYLWQWGKRGSPVAYDQVKVQRNNPVSDCAVYDLLIDGFLRPFPCVDAPSIEAVPDGFLCMKDNPLKQEAKRQLRGLHLLAAEESITAFPTKTCSDGSLVQIFHDCKWNGFPTNQLQSTVSTFPDFQCQLGRGVHYSVVCDAIDDCVDKSDEINCLLPRHNPFVAHTFTCTNSQIIPKEKQCNGIYDCLDNSDEEYCTQCKDNKSVCPTTETCIPKKYNEYFLSCHVPKRRRSGFPPVKFGLAAVYLDGFGMSSLEPAGQKCSDGFFQCDKKLCIPTYLLNNGEQDCPDGVDEQIPVQNLTCPGYYRCHVSGNCIHSRYLCDGIPHCPNKDDERYCELSCPSNCTCEGYAFKCPSMFDPNQYLHTRYLDLSGVTQPSLKGIQNMDYLFFLNLSHCTLKTVNLTSMPQLQILDLSYNLLNGLSSIRFSELTWLKYLSLSNNPLIPSIDSTFRQFVMHSGTIHLKQLFLVNIGLQSIEDNAMASLAELTELDLRDNDIKEFDQKVFSGLSHLKTLRADNYKLCCPYFHEQAIPECHTTADELSSCEDLLRNQFYHVSVWILAIFNIPANFAVLVYRLREIKQKRSKSYTIFVGNLCLSDLLMGIYLVFIGAADVHYRDVWVSKTKEWTSSGFCLVAGLLAFLSSEVSAFVICLITLERLLVICFPLRRHLHMTTKSAWWACVAAWLLGLLLVLVPLMAGWDLYGQSGFCLPLPITRTQFPGQQYVFAVFIYVNFALFIIIGIGQVCMYKAFKSVRMSTSSHSKQQDMTIARRLMLVVFTDFLCWFPIGFMGVLSSMGTPIPGEVNVWAALFILPFNSALNPHLYTLNTLLDRYRERRLDRRIQKTISKINAEILTWPPDKVESLLKTCLQARVIEHRKILQWLKLEDCKVNHGDVELDMVGGCEDARSDSSLAHA